MMSVMYNVMIQIKVPDRMPCLQEERKGLIGNI